jgi:predicted acylesterase/phospholipase RssA
MTEQELIQSITEAEECLRGSRHEFMGGNLPRSHQLRQRAKELFRESAKHLLNQQANVDPVRGPHVANRLKSLEDHGLARRILSRLGLERPGDTRIAQQLALSTYKDEELPPDFRFAEALRILEEIGLRNEHCNDPETLGLGGAVYKRRWERSGLFEDLQASLFFYKKGWLTNPQADQGYCGINAAYVLDLHAFRERVNSARLGIDRGKAEEYELEAGTLREEIRARLPLLVPEANQSQYWYLVTKAEAGFGLSDYETAARDLHSAQAAEHSEWETQTTALQLVSIARMRRIPPPSAGEAFEHWHPAWRALSELVGEDARAVIESHRGKVGLALSGGGFRASLFHLGVLARLAECDALRGIETLSTVSGGSIVGAHYYLAQQHLLETKVDTDISAEDYVHVVRNVMTQFLSGVQQNIRCSVLTNLGQNIKMFTDPKSYGRSNRAGELYEAILYSQVKDGKETAPRKLTSLLIRPKINAASRDPFFKPKFSNWRRRAKVPTFLINATSLNSGHSWHFTGSWMGEPPGLIGQEIDVNERYRRLYYDQAPTPELKDYRLGNAVAASAGVPELFDPLVLQDLYPGRTVKLVDGGVHDNQGVEGLLDEGCTLILCSDASGQMGDVESPATGLSSVFFRSDGIFQDRIREAQYQDLAARAASRSLQGLFFIHMKQDLETDPIDWVDCQDPGKPTPRLSTTPYGVDRTIQRHLSELRTDLDTFTEAEAYALMGSGYLMTEHQLRKLDQDRRDSGLTGSFGGFDINAPRRADWPFVPLLPVLAANPSESDRRATDLDKQLRVGREMAFKVWRLVPTLQAIAIVTGIAVAVIALLAIRDNWTRALPLPTFTVGGLSLTVVIAILTSVFPLLRFLNPRDSARSWLYKVLAAFVGWVAANVHVVFFDPLFKKRGKLERLLKLPGKP